MCFKLKSLLEFMEKNIEVFVMIFVFSVLSMIVYAVSSKEQPKQPLKSTVAGGVTNRAFVIAN